MCSKTQSSRALFCDFRARSAHTIVATLTRIPFLPTHSSAYRYKDRVIL